VAGIPLNNPENDVAPLVHTATSGLGRLRTEGGARFADAPWVEGSLHLDEAPAPESRPNTFVELSKGTNDLRQRRVRFSSEEGVAGLDLAYDEVLNDGYQFDASESVPDEPNYGKARSRGAAIVLRGTPAEASYAFGVRRYRASTTGDLTGAAREATTDGHLLWLDAGVGAARVVAYGRGYTSSDPDSQSTNETVGGIVGWDAVPLRRATVSAAARVERTRSTVDVGERASASLTQVTLTAAGGWRVGASTDLFVDVSAAGDDEVSFAWGATARLRQQAGASAFAASARRSFRLPNLGERYLPAHVRDGRTLAGDAGLDAELAWEAGLEWEVSGRGVVNRVRAAWIRSADEIAFRPRAVGSETWRVAGNANGDRSMRFFEERLQADVGIGPLRARLGGSVLYTTGDRAEAFASVPELMTTATALIGGEMFEATSALYVGGEFIHVDERVDFGGAALPSFDVLNLLLEGRLLDARLYLKYLNALDQVYRTEGDYLMTPSTLAYGIEWTLFD
jgi:hypothetical protein